MRLTCQTDSAIDYLLTSAVALVLAATFAEASAAEEDEARVSSSAESCETATAFDELTNRSFELDPPSSGWRSQLASFPTVYWDETGVSSPLLPEEDTSSGLFAGVGSDCDTPLDPGEAGVDLVTHPDYLRSTKAPAQSPASPDILAAEQWLAEIDCDICPTANVTGPAAIGDDAPWLSAPESAATARRLGTASLWDLRTQNHAMRPRVAARYPWLSAAQNCQLMSFHAPAS